MKMQEEIDVLSINGPGFREHIYLCSAVEHRSVYHNVCTGNKLLYFNIRLELCS